MRFIQKVICAACYEGRDWKCELTDFCLITEQPPHATTQHGHVMFGRHIRTKIPDLPIASQVQYKFEKLCADNLAAKLKTK